LADSSFTTFFGKPAFHAYGNGNTTPMTPATKLMTHNINGVTGKQKGQFAQVFDSAFQKGMKKTGGVRVPVVPRQRNKENVAEPSQGPELMPKTLKKQKEESIGRKKGFQSRSPSHD